MGEAGCEGPQPLDPERGGVWRTDFWIWEEGSRASFRSEERRARNPGSDSSKGLGTYGGTRDPDSWMVRKDRLRAQILVSQISPFSPQFTLFSTCSPASRTFRASTVNFFFPLVLLLGLTISAVPVLYSIFL